MTVGRSPKTKEGYHAAPMYADIRGLQHSFFFLICVVNVSAELLGEKAMALVLRLLSFFARPKKETKKGRPFALPAS